VVKTIKGIKSLFPLFFLTIGLLAFFNSRAQDNTKQNEPDTDTLSPKAAAYWDSQRDVLDIARKIVKNKKLRQHDSTNIHVSLLPAFGYTLQTGWAGVVTANLAFYTSAKHSTEKISSVLSSLAYTQHKQVIFPIQGSIWTKKDNYNIIIDWRYLNYPSTTFGLGGHTSIKNGVNIDYNYIRWHQSVLRRISGYLYGGIGYYYDRYWNIREINPPVGVVTDFEKYGLVPAVTASGVTLRLLLDSRKNQINAKQGWYVNIVGRPNFKALGSSNNWQSLLAEFRHYIPINTRRKSILALWSYNWLTLGGKPPYLLLPSTGWDDYSNTGRGYIQGRFRGRQMLYMEAEYRFSITHSGLLGGVVFVNAQSFSKDINQQFTVIAPAAGAGLRIKLNKFSNTNLCIDYGIGIEGSSGFFVNVGEVF